MIYKDEKAAKIKVGETEFEVHEGMAFLVPAGVWHTLCSCSDTEPLMVLWFHSAV